MKYQTKLLSKIEHYGVRGQELALMSSFLSSRQQFVEIDDMRPEYYLQ